MGTFGIGKEKIEREKFTYINLEAQGLTSKRPDILFLTASRMLRALSRSLKELKAYQPDVVAGFGGYGAFPVVLAGLMLKIPTIIHEQNVVPGRANKWLARFVRKIAISFPETKKHLKVERVVITGCPTHISTTNFSRQKGLELFGLKPGKFTILVFGGSQGSHALNEIFLQTAKTLNQKMDFQVIHVTGKKDLISVQNKYAEISCSAKVFDFINDMGEAYAASDLVIGRSGAATVTELAMFSKPAILIPYPHAGGHQKENALIMVTRGLAEIIEEKDLTTEGLAELILEMYDHTIKDIASSHSLFKDIFVTNATERIAKTIMELKT